jgi:hypothetical protein
MYRLLRKYRYTAAVAGATGLTAWWIYSHHSEKEQYDTADEKLNRVGEFCLCIQKGGRCYRDDDETLRMTFAAARAICKERNRSRKKGNKLCVVPHASVAAAKVGCAFTVDSVANMAQRSTGNYLNMRRQNIDNQGVASVIQWCKDADPAKNFTHLGLTDNNIGDDGVSRLMVAVADGSICVHGIFLSTNQIGCAGVRRLAQHLCKETNEMVKVGLNFNEKIGCGGAQILAKAIPFSNLEVLGLTHCNICNRGCIALARALEANPCITRLFLNDNMIGDEGAVAMATMLTKSSTSSRLLRLGLAQCKYTSEGAAALRTALKTNRNLERLCMFGNEGIGSEEHNRLQQTERINLEPLHGSGAKNGRQEVATPGVRVDGSSAEEEARLGVKVPRPAAPAVAVAAVAATTSEVGEDPNVASTLSLALWMHPRHLHLLQLITRFLPAASVAKISSLNRHFRKQLGALEPGRRSLVWWMLLQRDYWSPRCEPLCSHKEHHWRTIYQHAALGATTAGAATTAAAGADDDGNNVSYNVSAKKLKAMRTKGGSMKGRKIFVCEVCEMEGAGSNQRFGLLKKLHNHLRRTHNITCAEISDGDAGASAANGRGGAAGHAQSCCTSGDIGIMGSMMQQEQPHLEMRQELTRMRHRYPAVNPMSDAHLLDRSGYVHLLYPPPPPLPLPSFGCCCAKTGCQQGGGIDLGLGGGCSGGVSMVGRRIFVHARGKHSKQGGQHSRHALVLGVKQREVKVNGEGGEGVLQELVEVKYVDAAADDDAATVVCAHPPHFPVTPSASSASQVPPLRLQLVAVQPGPCVIVTAVTRHFRDLCYSQCELGDSVVEIGSSYGLSTRIIAHQVFGLHQARRKAAEGKGRVVAVEEGKGRVVAVEVSRPLLADCRNGSMQCWNNQMSASVPEGGKNDNDMNRGAENKQGRWHADWYKLVEWELLDAVDHSEGARAKVRNVLVGQIDKVFIDIGGNRAVEDGLLSLVQFVQAEIQPKVIVVKCAALAMSACGHVAAHNPNGSKCEPTDAVPHCAKWLASFGPS